MNQQLELSVKNDAFDPDLYNEDLAPVKKEKRDWTWLNYTTVWMGMVHNIVAYETAGSLLGLGMNVWQALATVLVANVILIAAMWLNSVAGAKYGLPFPVLIRAIFGYKGVHVPVLIRAFVGIFWFCVQTYLGCKAVGAVLGLLIPGWNGLEAYSVIGMNLNDAISFVIFWFLHVYVVSHGMNRIKFFELWAGPLVIVLGLGLVVWAISTANGLGPLFSEPSTLTGGKFWSVFFLSVTGLIGTWATLILNIPDFTRFARSQKDQIIGQAVGLPGTAIIFSIMSIVITSGTVIAFGRPIWDPVELLIQFDNPIVLILGAFSLLIATLSVNVAANVVSPAYDLINLMPRKLNFVRAGIISMILGLFFVPWLWIENSGAIFSALGAVGGALGPVAGIMIADFYLVRKGEYDVDSFYTKTGAYAYSGGWNPRAFIALFLGLFASFIGLVIPALHSLYTFSWFLGVGVGFVAYTLLMRSVVTPVSQQQAPLIRAADE
ncbi:MULTISPECIES: NCS1 family nucleobase:cation symporter-1 [unclassified Paenibacillus]|uniref:NCS1 family nucleobase:cation symporter-1 n=1 Tax=unclassified Paenibacillus TaxID=185978 RepID=UPI0024066E85|nr:MULTISPECIES: NCS1 family nucleobase:cation symporter-1 [unclassified Paenibacillus]MDF9844509.1 NCS1 family nucleobase:cation symporter-1 [Paenibacillus sp. PastF-2]MDF9851113.1 NCS1 family nucleobase:cation symporter-1 [Paenibacillus sp. PastM-2]MDF9857685.1 NCS1 family nucleobase:cation symporter-1 [Paenibacillus sp. PastF-1]MDH6482951.1 NCS1 family nucleobase:cation symporter-1 [Paenibacillus sp. PastH-2]MDH6510376.1 NCS1 family nucleobase:cation symporter-1 [Paenibacillus sp. PastM-3]